ncbi:ras guanine nucleotide exchange factor R-like [Wyeomyia smithii]|uniref:ras guanine nucleotide exchange factor R-like n=1 Tax=Wyeomyia smithii TaxID=174621 RepID=UPI002467C417|nr:ras guanine nucleotide exchange factor R-like [Wyeomyia smithii]
MELEHLADDELDFEWRIRGLKETKGQDKLGKLTRLRQVLKNKSVSLPTTSSHIMSDVDNIYQCQARLQNILLNVEMAIRQNNAEQLKMCRSRLMHYQLRLSLITDSLIVANANKSLAKIKQTLARIQDFLMNQPTTNSEVKGDAGDVAGDAETLQKLENPQLQSSMKESQQTKEQIQNQEPPQQQTAEQILMQQQREANQQLQHQLEDERRKLHQLQLQLQQEQQLLSRQQQQQHDSHQWEQWQNQQEQMHQQQVQQLQLQQQELQHLLQQERAKRQQLENQMGHLQQQQQNFSQQQEPGLLHSIPGVDQLPHDLRNDFMRFLRTQHRPNTPRSSGQAQSSDRFTQPVHKWPFEYAGQPNIIQLGEFLNQVNTYADTEGIEEQTLLRSIKHLLKGRALQWYTRSYLHLTNWEVFKSEIKQEFLPPNYSEIIKQDLYLRFQGPNESFTTFYRDLVAAFEIVEPAISETERLFIVKSHLNSDYTPIAAASRVSTVRELVTVCKDFEVSRSYSMRGRSATTYRSLWNKPEQRPGTNRMDIPNRPSFNRQPHYTAQINSMELSSELEENLSPQDILEREMLQHDIALRNEVDSNNVEEVNALRLQNNSRERPAMNPHPPTSGEQRTREWTPSIICWQCEKPGHTYPNCPNPKHYLFCYSCGRKGCTTRNCEACISRWRQLDSTNGPQHPGNRSWENPQ